MNSKVVKLREEQEKNSKKIASLQARNKKIDEADLPALMEDGETETTPAVFSCTDKCIVGNINTACEVCHTSMSACVGKEAVKEPDPGTDTGKEPTDEPSPNEQSGNSMLIVVVLVLAIAGGGAVYWFKFRKPRITLPATTILTIMITDRTMRTKKPKSMMPMS